MAGCQTAPSQPAPAELSNSPRPRSISCPGRSSPSHLRQLPLAPRGPAASRGTWGFGTVPRRLPSLRESNPSKVREEFLTRLIAGRQIGAGAHLRRQRAGMRRSTRERSIKSYKKCEGISSGYYYYIFFFFLGKSHALPGFLGVQHFCTASSLASLKHAEGMSQGLQGEVILTQK